MDAVAGLRLAIVEFQTLGSVLHEDVYPHRKAYFDAPTQAAARTLIRSAFALIEGQTYRLKQWALQRYRQTRQSADPGELALLEEVAFDLNEKGKVTRRSARIRTEANIRFAFEAIARAHGYPYEFKTEELGWGAFQQALKTRHRLTHPKSANDLHVEDDEVVVALAAVEWFHHSSMGLLIEAVREMSRNAPKLVAELRQFEARWNESSKRVRDLLMTDKKKRPTNRSLSTSQKRPAG